MILQPIKTQMLPDQSTLTMETLQFPLNIDWVHLGTLGTGGGKLVAAQQYAPGRLRGPKR
jgi:hypothetical protein